MKFVRMQWLKKYENYLGKVGGIMQQCDICDNIYDESEGTCPYCVEDTDGYDEGDCPECNGRRKEECYVCEGEGINPDNDNETCSECNGTGELDCALCLDEGRI